MSASNVTTPITTPSHGRKGRPALPGSLSTTPIKRNIPIVGPSTTAESSNPSSQLLSEAQSMISSRDLENVEEEPLTPTPVDGGPGKKRARGGKRGVESADLE